jgi:uncharacterized membrane protein (DUF2068 family)
MVVAAAAMDSFAIVGAGIAVGLWQRHKQGYSSLVATIIFFPVKNPACLSALSLSHSHPSGPQDSRR